MKAMAREQLRENLMSQFPGTDIWFKTYRVRSDVRFTYKFSVDDSLVPEEDETSPTVRDRKSVV